MWRTWIRVGVLASACADPGAPKKSARMGAFHADTGRSQSLPESNNYCTASTLFLPSLPNSEMVMVASTSSPVLVKWMFFLVTPL